MMVVIVTVIVTVMVVVTVMMVVTVVMVAVMVMVVMAMMMVSVVIFNHDDISSLRSDKDWLRLRCNIDYRRWLYDRRWNHHNWSLLYYHRRRRRLWLRCLHYHYRWLQGSGLLRLLLHGLPFRRLYRLLIGLLHGHLIGLLHRLLLRLLYLL